MNRDFLEKLARRWRQLVIGRELSFANAAGCLAMIPLLLWPGSALFWLVVVALAVVLISRLAISQPWQIDAARVAHHLDRTYPELEESSSLLLKAPAKLSLLERMQLQRVDDAARSRLAGTKATDRFGLPPRRFLDAPLCWLFAALLLIACAIWARQHHGHSRQSDDAKVSAPVEKPKAQASPLAPAWPKIMESSLLIEPPAYTGKAAKNVDGLNAEAEEGADVTWQLTFDQPIRDVRLVFGDNNADQLRLARVADGTWRATRIVTNPELYHLAGTLPNGDAWNPPDIYALKIIKDLPAVVRIIQPASARTALEPAVPPAAAPRVEVEVIAGDDYGVASTQLIATVAKGSGEAVKFREQPLPFTDDSPALDAGPHARRLTRTIDLGALGMEPGDELYFFVEARDNREPTANRTRSETRFITLKGPGEMTTTAAHGVTGVNLIPQYFRSERQIIIDTEKLIAEQPTIPAQTFRDRANNLGIDQQLLRLRYGQLLGEELEGGSGDHTEVQLDPLQRTAPDLPATPHAAASIKQRFLQEHATQDREGGSDAAREAGQQVDHPDKPLPSAQVIAPFVDQHDSQDNATYYDKENKGTMHDALAAMWDAEKFLRTSRPPEALPSEHRALEILKDLQQSARAYVQRVGFDAAPIKIAERRLTGDAAQVPARADVADTLAPNDPAVTAARRALADLNSDGADRQTAFRAAEPALTKAAVRQPDIFLPGLSALRRLQTKTGSRDEQLRDQAVAQQALLKLLPPAQALPERASEVAPSLAPPYFGALR